MASQKLKVNPHYKKIYSDLIASKFPNRLEEFKPYFNKTNQLSAIDVIRINEQLFGIQISKDNKRLRSYEEKDIREILNYQKNYNLNNTLTAKQFKISRNTVAKWKKVFIV